MIDENSALIPVDYSANIVHLLEKKGFSGQQVLEKTNISMNDLHDGQRLISFLQQKQVILNAIALSGMPELGLLFGSQLNLASHGAIGLAAITRPTLREAIDMTTKYARTRNPLLAWSFVENGEHASLQFEEAFPLAEARLFIAESLFASMYSVSAFLFKHTIKNLVVSFAYPPPPHVEVYKDYFHCKVLFNQPVYQIRLPTEMLDFPILIADPVSSERAEKQCQEELQQLDREANIISHIRSLLLQQQGVFPSMEEIAEQLCVSPRTLHRHLKKCGTTYREILDGTRLQLAKQCLSDTDLGVDEIAERLGYKDPSNFGRAFKKWTGMAPGYYRLQQRTDVVV